MANPYGFSAQQRDGPLQELVGVLESLGADVWEPFARNNQIDRASAGWAYRIGQADLRDVREADGLFAVVNGCPPDEGVMVELGMAIAWEKPVFLFRDDFRRCTDSEVYPLKLAISEFPKWRKYLISLSFRGQSSVRPVQVGGFDVNIVIHRSTAVRGRGGPARHDAWPPSLGAILAHTDGPCGS